MLFDAVSDILPVFGDMASILGDIAFFTDETLGLFGDWEADSSGIVDFLEKQLNPMKKIADTVERLAKALTDAREAYSRFLQAGGGDQLKGVIAPGTIGGRRAAGGPVSGGSSYLVGERGPEIFTPMSSGNITPNSALGGGTNINITVNAGMGANGPALGQAIVSAIKRYERTSGPVFASA